MRLLRLQHLRRTLKIHRKSYVWLNATVYGALVGGLVVGALVPGMREQWVAGAEAVVRRLGLSAVPDAYTAGDVVPAATRTFAANLLLGAVLTTTVPSLAVPYVGVVATIARAGLIGILLAPASLREVMASLPHTLAVVVEFQAMILAALGSALLWQKTFAPGRHGLTSALAGYRAGLRDNAHLYGVITAVLFVAAVYEAIEVIHVLPRLH